MTPPHTSLDTDCLALRGRYEPGEAAEHLRSCRACQEWARPLEALTRGGLDEPLPPRLRARLRHVAGGRRALDQPLPAASLPDSLTRRLRALPRRCRPLPQSVRHSAYGLAASYLLVVALGLLVGNPYRRSLEIQDRMRSRVDVWLQEVEGAGRDLWSSVAATSAEAERSLERRRQEIVGRSRELLDDLRSRLPLSPAPAPETERK